jgi:hypothetical protein
MSFFFLIGCKELKSKMPATDATATLLKIISSFIDWKMIFLFISFKYREEDKQRKAESNECWKNAAECRNIEFYQLSVNGSNRSF